jgi:D-alanyl-D-alanine carboxypeptidase (penicillin-binding protein 5/6)
MAAPNATQRSNYMSLFRKTAFVLLSLAATAQAWPSKFPVPPSLAAKSWLLLEMGSNQVLTTEKPDERLEPASLTKLMTAYLTFAACARRPSPSTSPCRFPKRPGAPAAPRCSSGSTRKCRSKT